MNKIQLTFIIFKAANIHPEWRRHYIKSVLQRFVLQLCLRMILNVTMYSEEVHYECNTGIFRVHWYDFYSLFHLKLFSIKKGWIVCGCKNVIYFNINTIIKDEAHKHDAPFTKLWENIIYKKEWPRFYQMLTFCLVKLAQKMCSKVNNAQIVNIRHKFSWLKKFLVNLIQL